MSHNPINSAVNCGNGEEADVWYVEFLDMVAAFGAGLIVQPIISYLEVISLGKNFAKKDHYQIDPTQVNK